MKKVKGILKNNNEKRVDLMAVTIWIIMETPPI